MTTNTINDAVTMAGGGETLLAGRYRVVRQLGQGGMGSVWLAEDTQLDNKQFAIKMLPSILVSNKRAYRQLKDEALVAMQLVHPNIVQIRAFEENSGNPFLVMDYVDGQTLDDYLAEKDKLSEDETIRLLKPIAAALDYAHGKGVVHRDVKPGNVMIAKDGTPFILDFGIAREIQETMTRVTGKLSSGTLLYMSPEQLRGQPPKPAQDVYSFAAMAYECLSGNPPFYRGAIEDQIKNERPEPLSGGVGGDCFVAAVMAGLAKEPEDRPPNCAAVVEVGGFKRRNEDGQRGKVAGRDDTIATETQGTYLLRSEESHTQTQADCARLMADARVAKSRVARFADDPDCTDEIREIDDDFIRADAFLAEKQWSLAAGYYARIIERAGAMEEFIACREANLRPSKMPEAQGKTEGQDSSNVLREECSAAEPPLGGVAGKSARAPWMFVFLVMLAAVNFYIWRMHIVGSDGDEARSADVELERPHHSGRDEERFARELFLAISGLCSEREMAGLSSAWPKSRPSGDGEDLSEKAYVNSSEYFRELLGLTNNGNPPYIYCPRDYVFNKATGQAFWSVALDVTSEMPDSVPVIISSNFDCSKLSPDNGINEVLPVESCPICGERSIVVVQKSGKVLRLSGKNITLSNICNAVLSMPSQYLTPNGMVRTKVSRANPNLPTVYVQDSKSRVNWRKAGEEFTINEQHGLCMTLKWCPPGTFTMGSPSDEDGRFNNEVQHQVTLTKGFWLGETEVTQGQWKKLMDGETVVDLARKGLQDDTKYNFSGKQQTLREFWGMDRYGDPNNRCGDLKDDVPVYNVSWSEATEFCRRLTQRERAAGRIPDGYEYRLPTEAEWEYACRAGTTTALPNGRDIRILGENNAPALDDIAWYGGNSSVRFDGRGRDTANWKEKQYPGGRACAREVKGKRANAWGIYDMLGNVLEWCADWAGDYKRGPVEDPTGYASGSCRVLRGGGWCGNARDCRSAARDWGGPGSRGTSLGFRVALAPSH